METVPSADELKTFRMLKSSPLMPPRALFAMSMRPLSPELILVAPPRMKIAPLPLPEMVTVPLRSTVLPLRTAMPSPAEFVMELATTSPSMRRLLPLLMLIPLPSEFCTATFVNVREESCRFRPLPWIRVNLVRLIVREAKNASDCPPGKSNVAGPWIVNRLKPLMLVPAVHVPDTLIRFGPSRSAICASAPPSVWPAPQLTLMVCRNPFGKHVPDTQLVWLM